MPGWHLTPALTLSLFSSQRAVLSKDSPRGLEPDWRKWVTVHGPYYPLLILVSLGLSFLVCCYELRHSTLRDGLTSLRP